jgi:hypothetical protein
MKTIYPFFKWIDGTWMNKLINDSNWLFPAIEAVHIVALALLFGAVIVLNLRLLGFMMRGRSLPQLARELEPFTLVSLIVILASGVLLFVSEAVKSFYSTPFRIKMVLLLSAIVFHFAVSWRLSMARWLIGKTAALPLGLIGARDAQTLPADIEPSSGSRLPAHPKTYLRADGALRGAAVRPFRRRTRYRGDQGTLELAALIGDYVMAEIMLHAVDPRQPLDRPLLLPQR